MFTVKHVFNGSGNYHAWSVDSYFVDHHPNGDTDGNSRGAADSTHEVAVFDTPQPQNMVYPRVTLELPGGKEFIIDVCGTMYVENSAGKTIDRVAPLADFDKA